MAVVLSTKHMHDMREAFNLVDSDKSGSITVEELVLALEALNYPKLNDSQLEAVFNSLDMDQSGTIEFGEFVYTMIKIREEVLGEKIVLNYAETFAAFDSDGDGWVTADELYHMVNALGGKISRNEAMEMVRKADRDRDYRIDITEFVDILRQLKLLQEKKQKRKCPCRCVLL